MQTQQETQSETPPVLVSAPSQRRFMVRYGLPVGTVTILAILVLIGLSFRGLLNLDSWINVALQGLIPFAMGWGGVYLAARALTSPTEKGVFISAFTVLFLVGIALIVWQQRRAQIALDKASHRRHPLTRNERASFEGDLKTQKDTDLEIQFACPTNDETACVYAEQFVNLFGGADWKVQPSVQRVVLTRARDGITVYRRGGDKQAMQTAWNPGGWFEINEPHLLAVQKAFRQVHIEIEGGTNPELPENVMTIYFGPERVDESEPTSLTRPFAGQH